MAENLTPPENPTEEQEAESGDANYAVGIAIALPLGIALGLTVFDNIGIGILCGLALAPIFAMISSQDKTADEA